MHIVTLKLTYHKWRDNQAKERKQERAGFESYTNQLYEYTAAVLDWLRTPSQTNSGPINLFKPQNKAAGTEIIHCVCRSGSSHSLGSDI